MFQYTQAVRTTVGCLVSQNMPQRRKDFDIMSLWKEAAL